jgi:hypothetical protein
VSRNAQKNAAQIKNFQKKNIAPNANGNRKSAAGITSAEKKLRMVFFSAGKISETPCFAEP